MLAQLPCDWGKTVICGMLALYMHQYMEHKKVIIVCPNKWNAHDLQAQFFTLEDDVLELPANISNESGIWVLCLEQLVNIPLKHLNGATMIIDEVDQAMYKSVRYHKFIRQADLAFGFSASVGSKFGFKVLVD